MARVEFKADERNTRFRKAISKISGKLEGALRNECILADGSLRNTAIYSMIDIKWEKVKLELCKSYQKCKQL
nr:hypothetical protein [Ectobacillus panaciterrae]